MSLVSLIAALPWKPTRGAVANRYNSALYVRLTKVVNDPGTGIDTSYLGMFKSLDDGATWVQVGGDKYMGQYTCGNGTFNPGPGTMSAYAAAGTIYVPYNYYVFSVIAPTSQLNVATFDCNTDSWGADILGPDFSAPRFSVGYAMTATMGYRSDGTLILMYFHQQEVPPITRRYEFRVWTGAGGEKTLTSPTATTLLPTGGRFLLGPVIIDPADTAHLFYTISQSGTSTSDLSLCYRTLSPADALSAQATALDYTTPGNVYSGQYGGVTVDILGVSSLVFMLQDDSAFPYISPAALNGPAVTVPSTFTSDAATGIQPYFVTSVLQSAYAVWPYSNAGPGTDERGIAFGEFLDGAWLPAITVNDGLSGEPPFSFWSIYGVNDADGQALTFVMESADDETGWFAIYPLGGPTPPVLEPRVLWGSTNPQTKPACIELPTPAQWDYLKVGRARNATFSGCANGGQPLGAVELRSGPVSMPMPPPIKPLRKFGSRWLRCIP